MTVDQVSASKAICAKLRSWVLLATCFAVLGACQVAAIDTAPSLRVEDRLNIILINVEDLSPRLGAYGDPLKVTPNLDALAEEGVLFEKAFTTSPICSPSRAATITGRYQQTIGGQHHRTTSFGRNFEDGIDYLAVPPPQIKAFPEMLRAAGYYTVNRAKTDYQFGAPFTIWDQSGAGADWTSRAPGQPFFMMVSDDTTHESRLFRFDRPAQDEIEARIIPRNKERLGGAGQPVEPEQVHVPPYLADTLETRRDIARQYNNLALLDQRMGQLFERLKAENLWDKTIIIWTSDHGDGLPRHKRALYDSGLHVPLIVRFPDGQGGGVRRTDLVSFIDLAPTILALAGAEPFESSFLPGRDLFDADTAPPEYVFASLDRRDERPAKQRAVRDKKYKLIRNDRPDLPYFEPLRYSDHLESRKELWRLADSGGLNQTQNQYFIAPRPVYELYDTETDPFEINNLAADKAYIEHVNRLNSALERWIATLGEYENLSEKDLASRFWPNGTQPMTAPPTVCLVEENGLRRVMIRGGGDGASLGYRLFGQDGPIPNGWQLYRGAVLIDADHSIEAKAIRYGYSESPSIFASKVGCQ